MEAYTRRRILGENVASTHPLVRPANLAFQDEKFNVIHVISRAMHYIFVI